MTDRLDYSNLKRMEAEARKPRFEFTGPDGKEYSLSPFLSPQLSTEYWLMLRQAMSSMPAGYFVDVEDGAEIDDTELRDAHTQLVRFEVMAKLWLATEVLPDYEDWCLEFGHKTFSDLVDGLWDHYIVRDSEVLDDDGAAEMAEGADTPKVE